MFWPKPQSSAAPEAGDKARLEVLGARPGGGQITLVFTDYSFVAEPVELRLFNLNGQQLRGARLSFQEHLVWQLSDLPAGNYYLQVTVGKWMTYKNLRL